jgi:pimeloyl-ACP methyl ester carboxylesterase
MTTDIIRTRHDYQFISEEGQKRGSYHLWQAQHSGKRPPLFCVHGLTRNGRDFDRLAKVLAQDYDVFCPDVIGRGDSDWLTQPQLYGYPLYISQMTQLLQQIMPQYGVSQLDWVGTSMGGLIGMMLAAQPLNPIKKLVMNDVGYFIPKESLQRLSGYVGKSTLFEDVAAVESYFRQVADSFGPLTDEQWQEMAEHQSEPWQGKRRLRYDPAIAGSFVNPEAFTDIDLSAIWLQVNNPVLLIRGGNSDLLLPSTAQTMAEQDNVELAVFPGMGHAPALMARDQISCIRRFLTGRGWE